MSLRHTMLAILDWVPLHGYALRELVKGYAWLHPMTNANIYPTLRQLEADGLVSHTEEVHDGRLRKVYAATPVGREELNRWLSDPTQEKGLYRDPLLLKVCLLRDNVIEEARVWLQAERDRGAVTLEESQAFVDSRRQSLPKFTRMVGELGLELAQVRLRWLDALLAEIDRDLSARSQEAAQGRSPGIG
jgi:DNA-binding PadR family transcriptional regulator